MKRNTFEILAYVLPFIIALLFSCKGNDNKKIWPREYQIDLQPDGTAYIYDGERLVGKLPLREGESFHQLMIWDNQ